MTTWAGEPLWPILVFAWLLAGPILLAEAWKRVRRCGFKEPA